MAFKTYKIYTLGCKVNQYDSSKVARDLQRLGLAEVQEDADLAVVNTCTVTHSALAKDKKILEEARRQNPQAKFALVGCMPVNYREEAEALGVDYIYGASKLNEFIAEVEKEIASEQGPELLDAQCSMPANYQTDKSRYFLKIQDGCQQFCSYCIIAYNRGKLSSRNKDEVIEEVRKVTEQGVAEVVLCGIHLGLYGVDLPARAVSSAEVSATESATEGQPSHKYHLIDLLQELFKIETLKKIRLSSIEITEVNDELIELMKINRKFARHLHIPLQAGHDKILKSMNRPYDTEYFAERIAKLRAVAPEVAIMTDVIVGFPGETAENFQATLDFCRKINFSKIHVFPFSAHEKTPAYTFPDQIAENIKKQRARELQKVSDELEKKYNESFIGREIEVIIDGRSRGNNYRGKSEYYFDVNFSSEQQYRIGELVKVKNWNLV